ncbi:MAG: AsmA family protein [Gammaproteobacteria bacterium]|nr:AsmA family protein [Gammaproteobacteria bacterium]
MKTLFKIFAVICGLIVVAAVAVVMMVNPNDYKTQVQEQVKNQINRELELNGDISWSIYPTLGFATSDVYIKNPAGFNRENLLEIKTTSVGIDLLPLFSGEISVGKVMLDGFRLNVITKANGESNLDGLNEDDTKDDSNTETDTDTDSTGDNRIDKFNLGGIEITNAVIEIQDLQVKSTTKATIKYITLGQFSMGQDTDFAMAIDVIIGDDLRGEIKLTSTLFFDKAKTMVELKDLTLNTEFIGESLPNGAVSSTLVSNVSYQVNTGLAKIDDMQFSADDLTLTGWATLQAGKVTTVRFDFEGNEWDLNPYLPKSEASESIETTQDTSAEPDLSVLKTLDVKGRFTLAGLKASGLTLGKISSKIVVAKGKAKLAPLTANLYGGVIEVNATVDHAGGANRYFVTKKLKGIEIQPLMKDLAEMDLVSGSTQLDVTAKGQGLSVDKIKSGMIANGNFEITNGSLYGINIPQKIRSAKASLTGKKLDDGGDTKKTDFTALTGAFKLNKGLFDNTSLSMISPLLRLNGAGTANIISEEIDYKLAVTVVGSLKGQGSDTDLGGLKIPLKVSGSFTDPKFGLDTSGALKAKLNAEKDKLKEKAKAKLKDKLKDKFGGLFGN